MGFSHVVQSSTMSTPPQTSSAGELPMDPALADALRALLAPIAQLALARGLPCGALEEMLKEAFVDEALRAQPASHLHER
jgi:hypothetical protein